MGWKTKSGGRNIEVDLWGQKTGGRQPTPPTVLYVQHDGTMAGSEQDASANHSIQEGDGAKEMALVSRGGEGGYIQGL